MTTGTRSIGDFCWINMLTANPSDACAFFRAVLGWTYTEMPGIGYAVKVDGRDVGGLFDLHGPGTPPGTRPVIGIMMKVVNVDETCARIVALGGTAKPAFDVMGQGRMAVCFDPSGGEFDPWQPMRMHGTDVDSHAHGAPSWFELMTTDAPTVKTFYTSLFGWTSSGTPLHGDSEYTTFALNGTPIAGMMPITPDMGKEPVRWTTYFAVDDADTAVRVAAEHGGAIDIPVRPIPGIGRFASITSPQSVRFSVIEYGAAER